MLLGSRGVREGLVLVGLSLAALAVGLGVARAFSISPSSLSSATVGSSYSATLTAGGGTAPYTFALSAGALPVGLGLSSAGVLSGTPTAGGSFSFTVTATDATSATSSQAYSLTVNAPTIGITPVSLPAAAQNVAYTPRTLAASGGTAPYTFAATGGALPTGMSVTSSGVLSGTPTAAGSFPFTITATDSSGGTGPYAGTQSYTLLVNTITVPGAPTIGTATAGVGQASVRFTPPASDGGAAITGYTAISNPAGVIGTCAGSPCVVTGLTNGTTYTFSVTATNSVGSSAASAPSNSVTPKASQTITFNNPGPQNFGSSPTLTATASSGLPVSFSSSTGAICTITSGGTLTTITTGTCTINANQSGNGAYLAATQVSQTFTVGATQTITFNNPASQNFGTSPTLTATASSGLPVSFTSSTTAVCTITGAGALTFVSAGTCTIKADQGGNGVFWAATQVSRSFSVAPVVAGAATIGSATASDTQAWVSFTPPSFSGGVPITGYTATANPGVATATCASSPCVVTGLTNGTTYTFIVTATNSVGSGPASASSNSVTPARPAVTPLSAGASAPPAPGAPSNVVAVAGDGEATISCTAPVDASISSYTVKATPGGASESATSCPITVTGLVDGTTYTFTVTATSHDGTSNASGGSNPVTPLDSHAPSAPTSLVGSLSHGRLILSWHGSSDNIGVNHYEIYLDGTPIKRVSGTETTAATRAFEPRRTGTYRVRAFDAAGNRSPLAGIVTVTPVRRPKHAPRSIPRWAWTLLARQERGTAAKIPRRHLPPWYAAWQRWRLEPFRLI